MCGFCILSVFFSLVLINVHFGFTSERAGCFNLNVFFQSYDCSCSVTLTRGAEVWFVVYYCDIFTWIFLLYLLMLL